MSPGMSQIESSGAGRALVSVMVAVIVAAMIVSGFATPHLQRRAGAVLGPVLRATGLAQDWDMFAPDPARRTLYVSARASYSDRSEVAWRPPEGGRAFGAYRSYRWRKLATALQDDAHRETLWPSVARWLGETHGREGRQPVAVTFFRHWAPTPAPGTGGDLVWYHEAYYTLDLTR